MRDKQPESAAELPARFSRAWQLYARWGKLFGEQVESEVPDSACQAIQRITAAFRSLAEHERGHLADLLEKSDRQFAPMADPFRLGFFGHRWLDTQREREESYSDWLAWLLERMDSIQQVLQVFGLEHTGFGALVRGTKASVSREEALSIPDSELKRTDIVIRFADAGILLVEVKIRSLDAAGGAENLPVYLEWLQKRQPDAERRCAILLVPQSMESPCPEWEVRTWEDVSLSLRRQAAQNGPKKLEPLLAAITLCFAGAVEQNVLGLDGTGAAISAPQTALYLEQFLREANHEPTTVPL